MDLIVNTKLLEEWIENNSPMGIEKLAVKAQVSSTTIVKARAGKVPKQLTRKLLAEAMNVSEEVLFLVRQHRKKAS